MILKEKCSRQNWIVREKLQWRMKNVVRKCCRFKNNKKWLRARLMNCRHWCRDYREKVRKWSKIRANGNRI